MIPTNQYELNATHVKQQYQYWNKKSQQPDSDQQTSKTHLPKSPQSAIRQVQYVHQGVRRPTQIQEVAVIKHRGLPSANHAQKEQEGAPTQDQEHHTDSEWTLQQVKTHRYGPTLM